MAIAHPASSQAGPQPETQNQPEVQPEIPDAHAGIEPETAPPAAAPAESAGGAVSASEANNGSSAAHLSGYAAGDGDRCSRGDHQAGRSAAQYAHARAPEAGEAAEDRPGDAGYLRSSGASAGYGQAAGRA